MIALRALALGALALWASTQAFAQSPAQSPADEIKGKVGEALGAAANQGATADYKAAEAAVEAAWIKMPLTVQHPLFITQKSAWGIYEPRTNNEFKNGDVINISAEPLGYIWQPLDTGGYTFGLSVDLAIQNDEGNKIIDRPEFAKLALKSHERNKEFSLNFDVTVKGIKPGPYKIVITLHDLNSPKTASFSLPFKIVEGS